MEDDLSLVLSDYLLEILGNFGGINVYNKRFGFVPYSNWLKYAEETSVKRKNEESSLWNHILSVTKQSLNR